jgi:rSAM/selenodomain-associated transferase 2/rSAM/selenodomain-associated transferase 1
LTHPVVSFNPLSSDLHQGAKPLKRLIVFARYPEPGKSKTRLIPSLGPEGAADLQRQMTEYTLSWAKQLEETHPVSLELHYEAENLHLMQTWTGKDLSYYPQCEGDIGRRMAEAFRVSFQSGSVPTVLIGTDCPGLSGNLALKAFEALREHDLVLGPATDGGYCLIGLNQEIPQLFMDVPWGTGGALEKTLCIAKDLGLRVFLLDPLHDVDLPEDLPVWEKAVRQYPTISIVIPTLNEEKAIASCLASTQGAFRVERIVVDGGSTDRTVEIAASLGATVVASPGGRGRQMNTGARAATGDLLLFLHADTLLPEMFDHQARSILAQPGVAAGAFRLGLAPPQRGLRIIEGLANWRSERFQLPYGDQAIFLKRDLFHEMGGFREMPIMEDFELVRRLRHRGRVAIAPLAVVTSARRWLTLGLWRTTLINQAVIAGYCLGVSPACLADWYRRTRRSREAPSAVPNGEE